MTRIFKFLALGFFVVPAAIGVAATTSDTAPSAQSLLFDATYLLPLNAPSRLVYDYSTKTADTSLFGKNFDDQVSLRLAASADGGGQKDVVVDMFTGDREQRVGPLVRVSGNPIIMMFLEHDVSEMNMHIGGAPVYFRNVIRRAFRETAKLEPASFTWDGHQVSGTKITIQPFISDPNAERLQLFRSKTYEFIVSDAVPGGIYQMHSTIRADDESPQAAPAIDTKLTLKGIAYDQPQN